MKQKNSKQEPDYWALDPEIAGAGRAYEASQIISHFMHRDIPPKSSPPPAPVSQHPDEQDFRRILSDLIKDLAELQEEVARLRERVA